MYFSPQFVAVGTPVSVSRTGTPCISTFFSTICTRDDSSVLRPYICRGLSVLDHLGLKAFSDVQILVELRALVRLEFKEIAEFSTVCHCKCGIPTAISRTDTSLCHSLSQHSELHDAEFFHHFPGGLVLFRFSCFHGGHTTSNIIQLILFAFSGHF